MERSVISCGFASRMVLAEGENLKVLGKSVFRMGESAKQNCTGMKPTASAKRK